MACSSERAVAIINRDILDIRQFNVRATLRDLGTVAADREPGIDYSMYEFSEQTDRVRYAIKFDDYCAKFTSLDSLNNCFHQAAITDYQLRKGEFLVVAKLMDFDTREVQYRSVTLKVPRGSTVRSLSVVELFQQFCDATNEMPNLEGVDTDSECDSDVSGEEIMPPEGSLTHDQRVFSRRDLLDRMLRWVTMTSNEVLECYAYTGCYRHEQRVGVNSHSSFGMDVSVAFFIYALRWRRTMCVFRRPGARLENCPAFIVPSGVFTDRSTCINSFLHALKLFGDPGRLARVVPFAVGNHQLVAMQLKSDFCVWPAENCDMVVFLALYGFLTSERHFFLGHDEIFAWTAMAISWATTCFSPLRIICENGFYRVLVHFVSKTQYAANRRPYVTVDGKRYDRCPFDCYVQPRAVPLIPSGLCELFYGRRTLRLYKNILPADGSLAAVRIKRSAREDIDEEPRRGDRLLFY